MIPRETLLRLFDYNYWARDRQLAACSALSEEQFRRPLGGSFPSLQATLAHLLGVEWIWSERWYGRSPTEAEAQEFAPERFPNLKAIEERWRPVEPSVRRYLAALCDEQLTQELRYRNRQGEPWAYPLWQALFHLVNHQTYHRGQVTNMLRQLGATPLEVDYLVAVDCGLRV